MIVKDEEHNIRRALDSIKDVADEIIVVDTGSTDRTPQIVREYTDKLYFHPWKNDFSEARNNSLKYPTCEWVFIYDADEEVSEDFKKNIRSFLESLPSDVNTVYLPTLSYLDWDFKRTEVASTPRIFRNGTVYYKNIVHNQAIYKPKVVNANFLIYHYGYIWTRKLKKQKYERTASLIRKHLEACKDDTERLYYLVQLYKTEKTGGTACRANEVGWQALQLLKRLTSIPAIGLEFLYLFSVDLLNAGLNDLAEQLSKIAIQAVPEYPDPYLSLIHVSFKRKDWRSLLKHYNDFKKAVEHASVNIEKFGWTIMSFKDVPTADVLAMIAAIELEDYDKFNKIALERFGKNEDVREDLVQYLLNRASAKDVEKALAGLKKLIEFAKRKNLRLNAQPFYEKVVEKRLPVRIEEILLSQITPFSYVLLKRLETNADLLLDFLCSGQYEKLVHENGVGGLLFVYTHLPDNEKKLFLEKFLEDEDSLIKGVARALYADHLLKESRFLEAIRSYRHSIELVPELSQFIKPIVEDLKTRLDPTIEGVYEELYRFYAKQKEFMIDFKKYAGNDVSKLYLISDSDVALYVSAVHTDKAEKAVELLGKIKEPSKFPMYHYRMAKFYSKFDKEKAFAHHIKAVEENEKLADIAFGRFGYTGLYPNATLNWFEKSDPIVWVGNLSEKFCTLGVIHPVRAWKRSKKGLLYAVPYPIDESIKAYKELEKELVVEPFTKLKEPQLRQMLVETGWDNVEKAESLESFAQLLEDLGIETSKDSKRRIVLEGVETQLDLGKLLGDAKEALIFYHFPNLSDENDPAWFYPAFRILRSSAQMKKELSKLGYEVVREFFLDRSLRCVWVTFSHY
ncbi:MAG: glycosyltransferase family 2 protein [Pseudothermotoga sp.]|nr:glycosyltransferase family 2 protein [Pseudothermotoga sp.]HBT40360.1 glycosyltransferase [Pseudothermotoga sp.]HCO98954.1 glycosyltransferase [Pseudothermotoga sp.]